MSRRIKRRTFIGTVGAAAGTVVLSDPLVGSLAHAAANPNIYSGYSSQMTNGTTVDQAWVQAAMDAAIKAMTGKTSLGQAWEAAFPGITASKTISIKINCLKKEVSPQLATLKALVGGLTQMLGGSFPAGQIFLYDNTMPFSGLSGSDRMAAVYGASNLNALGLVHSDPSPQYSGSTFTVRGKAKYPATYLDQCDYGIDLAPLKRHQYYAGGITGMIKNMMGACSATKTSFSGADSTFHDSAPFQSFVDLFKNYMRAKLHVYLVDMVFAAKTENASGWTNAVNRITLGTDPCAVDSYVADTLNALGIAGTKAVPKALESAGLGTTAYKLVQPTVTLGPSVPTRDALDAKLREHRSGQANDADVRALIKQYRGP